MRNFSLFLSFFLINIASSYGQWSNRYPAVDGYGKHVYLEAFELPVLNSGPTEPAPSPNGNQVVFSAKGWLWVYELSTSKAERITFSPHIDSRPNWSPDGTKIVYVRDNGRDTQIILLDLLTKEESLLVDSDRLELDPIFSSSGAHVYYSSAKNGSFDLWKVEIATKQHSLITSAKSLERLPIPTENENEVIFLKKEGFSYDAIMKYDIVSDSSKPLDQENFSSQASFSLSPNNETLVYTWPNADDYELRLLNINKPESQMLLTKSKGLPLTPKFNGKGNWVYFSEFNKEEHSELKRISVYGGEPEVLPIKEWDWKAPIAKLKIKTLVDGKAEAVRLSITDSKGHPVIPNKGLVHSEGQNGMVFFYTPGEIEVVALTGELTITATHGFETSKQVKKVILEKGNNETLINLERIWSAREEGWYAADNHFHLNYGGRNQLDPEDILLDLKAEGIDVAYLLVANLGNRFLEENLISWKNEGIPLLRFGQEVRSHFFGHVNIIGTEKLFWPWVWGPLYDIYGNDDRVNVEPLRFAKENDALGGYVHPIGVKDPFYEKNHASIVKGLIADAVLEEVDMLEVACLWSDEIGTANLWHEFLNLGIPMAISAGSDVMCDYYRTMAIGATRVYVKIEGELTEESYLDGLKKGRSFVSNGPQLEFFVDGKQAGEIITTEKSKVNWELNVYTPVQYDKVEIFINGKVVWTKKSKGRNKESFKGSIEIQKGGWISVRVSGGESQWPMMDSYPFAQCSPIWFNEAGSTSAEAKVKAAKKLLPILKVSETMVKEAYKNKSIPTISAHFDKAEKKLLETIDKGE